MGMDGHIPDGGLDDAIAGAAGKAHQARQARVMAPEGHHQEAVLEGLAHPPEGTAAPAHRIGELLEVVEVDLPLLAQHQGGIGIGRHAHAMVPAVELLEFGGGGTNQNGACSSAGVILTHQVTPLMQAGSVSCIGIPERGTSAGWRARLAALRAALGAPDPSP